MQSTFLETVRGAAVAALAAALLAIPLALAAAGPALAKAYPPKDAAAGDSDFEAFRTKLRRVAAEHDLKGLISLSTDDVHLSFGGDVGEKGLKRLSRSPEFWSSLQRVLATAVAKDSTVGYVAPYWFTIEHDAAFDPYETYFVTGKSVVLRGTPEADGVMLDMLSYTFVRRVTPYQPNGDPEYVQVETSRGLDGYLPSGVLRSVVDYRVGFSKEGGAWKMRFFLAGD